MGQVTALPTGLIAPGTYPVAGCVQAGGSTTLQRKIRFDADGSVHWLDAANADAVLFTLAPSDTAQEDRSLYYFRPDNWGANLIHFEPGTGDNRAYVQSGPNAVNVFSAAGNLQENCPAAFNPGAAHRRRRHRSTAGFGRCAERPGWLGRRPDRPDRRALHQHRHRRVGNRHHADRGTGQQPLRVGVTGWRW